MILKLPNAKFTHQNASVNIQYYLKWLHCIEVSKPRNSQSLTAEHMLLSIYKLSTKPNLFLNANSYPVLLYPSIIGHEILLKQADAFMMCQAHTHFGQKPSSGELIY